MSRRVSLPGADELFRPTTLPETAPPPPVQPIDSRAAEEAMADAASAQPAARAAGAAPAPVALQPPPSTAAAPDVLEILPPAAVGEPSPPPSVVAAPPAIAPTAASNGGEGSNSTADPYRVTATPLRPAGGRRRAGAHSADANGTRGPSGRIRHDEKITVYVTADELLDLEHTRLMLRREHGVAVDRGRLVREAIHLALEDTAAQGEHSALLRRLRDA